MADSSPFDGSLECSECGNTDPANFVAKSNGKQLGRDDAMTFLLSEGETHALVKVECSSCGAMTARSIMNMER